MRRHLPAVCLPAVIPLDAPVAPHVVAAQERGNELSVTETSETGNAITSTIIHRKNISVFKTIDDSGEERTYHSLEELPPDLRPLFENAQKQVNDEE